MTAETKHPKNPNHYYCTLCEKGEEVEKPNECVVCKEYKTWANCTKWEIVYGVPDRAPETFVPTCVQCFGSDQKRVLTFRRLRAKKLETMIPMQAVPTNDAMDNNRLEELQEKVECMAHEMKQMRCELQVANHALAHEIAERREAYAHLAASITEGVQHIMYAVNQLSNLVGNNMPINEDL